MVWAHLSELVYGDLTLLVLQPRIRVDRFAHIDGAFPLPNQGTRSKGVDPQS